MRIELKGVSGYDREKVGWYDNVNTTSRKIDSGFINPFSRVTPRENTYSLVKAFPDHNIISADDLLGLSCREA